MASLDSTKGSEGEDEKKGPKPTPKPSILIRVRSSLSSLFCRGLPEKEKKQTEFVLEQLADANEEGPSEVVTEQIEHLLNTLGVIGEGMDGNLSEEERNAAALKQLAAIHQIKKGKTIVNEKRMGRNEACTCGCGKKFKNCPNRK